MPENLTFYKCSENALSTITALAQQIWPTAFKDILTDDQIDYMLNWMYSADQLKKQLEDGNLFFQIRLDNTPIGFVGLQENYPDINTLRIHKFYLLPEYQGKKIGKWMMEQIQELAVANNQVQLHLNVNKFNHAVQFYERAGFVKMKEEDIDIGQGYFMNDYVMVKDL